jgi:hypothetical protein
MQQYRIIGYGICGSGEANRYLENTLKEFKRLCDETIIVLNNAGEKERKLVEKYGFHIKEDNREWGLNQHRIKQELMKDVEKLNPDWCICLDMDEVFKETVTRELIESYFDKSRAFYVYVCNLIDEGWNRQWSFYNVRIWKWDKDVLNYFGEEFYRFESKPLHCGLAPRWAYLHGSYAPFVLYHYGLKEAKDRERKVERYNKYDPESKYKDDSYYSFLRNSKSEPMVDVEKYIQTELSNISYNDRPIQSAQGKAFCFFRRKKDGFVFDVPEKHYTDTKKNQDFEELYWIGK